MMNARFYVKLVALALGFWVAVAALLWTVATYGPALEAASQRHRAAQELQDKKDAEAADSRERDGIVGQIKYLRDKRTTPPTCTGYAEWWASGVRMVSFIGVRSCEGIPPELFAPSQR